MTEALRTFDCFGGTCTVAVGGTGPAGTAADAVDRVARRMLVLHDEFTRFDARSELSRLNADPRESVPVSRVMARFVEAALAAAEATGGLIDPTLIGELERAGYRDDFASGPLPLARALRLAPSRRPARPRIPATWSEVAVDRRAAVVHRPPGVRLDSGGIAKGLFGDILAGVLCVHASFAIDACGDLRFGGAAGFARPIRVASPFDESVLHVFELVRGAAATSGIGRRSWLGPGGRPCHHLLDPATGRPAFTGIVQVTALAPSGVEAEMRSKAALLSGPAGAREWLEHGGAIVYDDGHVEVVEPAAGLCAAARVPSPASAGAAGPAVAAVAA